MTTGKTVLGGCLAALVLVGGSIGVLSAQNGAQSDAAQLDELVLANHILTMNGVLDAYGHVSVRSARNPNHYFLARHLPAGVVTRADIMEYDLDSKPVNGDASGGYTERYIHGEIYRARPDVMAIVHCHPADLVAFSVSGVPLRPLIHTAGFLSDPVPVFEIRKAGGMTDMLIRNPALGRALAETLGNKPVVLLRGHGAVVTGNTLHVAVGRAYFTVVNARVQQQAMQMGGKVTYLEPEEARKSGTQDGFERAWTLWKQEAEGK
ncbi:MAG TPA: class II aldolase/adducin family protein [Bryobacteraceae bacterium]|nr:class II aldolase/adducin family protein [Bryobacteraceae bacterium]